MSNSCLCGNNTAFKNCCQPKHLGTQPATTPEQLMRSRYSAFCDGNIDYLSQTLAPEKRGKDDSTQLQQTIKTTQWCRLQVIKHNQKGDQGQVEFVAFFTEHGKVGQLHELSEFVRRDNLWYYLDGVQLPLIKLQRNDPCWCGSGKKLKKCCNNFS